MRVAVASCTVLAGLFLLAGCSSERTIELRDASPDRGALPDSSAQDHFIPADSAPGADSAAADVALRDALDAGALDIGADQSRDVAQTQDSGGALDPNLELPDSSGEVCSTPGSMTECPYLQVCRFYDQTSGRCEGCDPCGNLGDSCAASSECDILFTCYQHTCTNICPLGSYYCGPIEDCLDVGYPSYGVCRP